MATITTDLGVATAYGYAKSKGYTGTEEEFAELMASYANVAEQAAQSASDAADSATNAHNSEVAASGSAGTAQTKAGEAANSAQSASGSAGTATNKAAAASADALKAEGYALGKQNGAAVASGSPYYHNNAEYFAGQAGDSASAAQAVLESIPEDYSALSDDVDDLKSKIDEVAETTSTSTALTATEYSGTYINGGTNKFGTGGASLKVYAVEVESGKTYHLSATNLRTLDASYAFAAFSESAPASGVSCTVLVNGSTTKVDSVEYDYTASANGYFSVVKGAETTMTYAFTEIAQLTHIITDKTLTVSYMPADAKAVGDRCDLLGYTDETSKDDVISAAYTVVNRYIASNGRISSAGSDAYPVKWYPVVEGKSYTITGWAYAGGSGQSLVCFDNVYDSTVGHICKEVIEVGSTTDTEYDIDYTPEENGYIVMPAYASIRLVVTLVSDTDFQRIYNIEKAVEDIEAEIGRTKMAVKIQLFGDSITDNQWGDKTTWANYITQNLSDYNVTVVNDAVGGSGIGHGKSSGTTESHQTEDYNYVYDLVTDGTTLQTDANYIVILVGTNNWTSGTDLGDMSSTGYATIYGALKGILEYISQHSAATVFVCTIPQRYNSADQSKTTNAYGEPLNDDGVSLADYCEAFRKVSAFYGMPCIHLNEDLGWNRLNISNFSSDGLHPNTKGDKMLSAFICNEIRKHIGKVSYT